MAVYKGYKGFDGKEYARLGDMERANGLYLDKWFPRANPLSYKGNDGKYYKNPEDLREANREWRERTFVPKDLTSRLLNIPNDITRGNLNIPKDITRGK